MSVFQVRIHGRGGQGVVTAAELLSVAAFREGRHAQAFHQVINDVGPITQIAGIAVWRLKACPPR